MSLARASRIAGQVAGGNGAALPGNEHEQFAERVHLTQAWMTSDRFRHTTRNYSAADVVRFQGSKAAVSSDPCAYPGETSKLYTMLRKCHAEGTCSHTFGALDQVQVTQMAAAGVSSVYVSGWQSSSTVASTGEPGPDIADYPANTLPQQVDRLVKAQRFHDRKQFEERMRRGEEWCAKHPATDFLRPIIADADTGHGGLSGVAKLTKLMIEAGAAGIHIEDQSLGKKKCGHMGGKVLVATEEHIQRLIMVRLQADILKSELVIVARTDAEAAKLIDSNIDARDHPFIVGATNLDIAPMRDSHLSDDEWLAAAKAMTYPDAVRARQAATGVRKELCERFEANYMGKSLSALKRLGEECGVPEIAFCWDLPRAPEGYYRIEGGTIMCAQRALAFAPYVDLLWMETSRPLLHQAAEFADMVKPHCPHLMLAYNLSPSFNWDAAGMTDDQLETYVQDLAKLGFCWQFITLAGFHVDALGTTVFARDFVKRGMRAYVELVQRKEAEHKVEALTHQKWSGSEYVDGIAQVVTGGRQSTGIMSAGVTEQQFD